jgi:hypothetical protein
VRHPNEEYAQKLIFSHYPVPRHIQKHIDFQWLALTLIGVFPRNDRTARFNLRLFQSSNSELGFLW